MSLGSWIKMIGGSIAAPFTAGATLPIAMSGLSDVLGNAAGASNKNRQQDNQTQLAYDRLNLDAPKLRARTALDAALAKNYSPRTVQWNGPGSGLRGEMPVYSGGFSDAMTKAKQDPMVAHLLDSVIAGKSGGDTTIPNYAPKGESAMDKILGGGGLASGILGAILKARGGPAMSGMGSPSDGEDTP